MVSANNGQPGAQPDGSIANGAAAPVLAMVGDLFFLAKIQETARQVGVKVNFAKDSRELLDGEAAPNLIILDLNNNGIDPLAVIARVRRNPHFRKTSVIGFLSHLQAELKIKAQEAGCDMVMPRSAFSQNLPALLRRHGLPAG